MEKQAFLQVINVMSAFCKTITLSKKENNAADQETVQKSNIKIGPLGMWLAETWRGDPDAHFKGFNINDENDIPFSCVPK